MTSLLRFFSVCSVENCMSQSRAIAHATPSKVFWKVLGHRSARDVDNIVPTWHWRAHSTLVHTRADNKGRRVNHGSRDREALASSRPRPPLHRRDPIATGQRETRQAVGHSARRRRRRAQRQVRPRSVSRQGRSRGVREALARRIEEAAKVKKRIRT